MFGAPEDVAQKAGTWQLDVSYRGLESDQHYRGTEREEERQELGNNVINRQNLLDFGLTYTVSQRLQLSSSVPIVIASWSIPLPVRPVPGERSEQNARGLGDITVMGRYRLLGYSPAARTGLSVGAGVKFPTGRHNAEDVYPDLSGQNPEPKAVDQSIQPGDGGWGMLLETQGFRRIGKTLLFGSLTYLMNPRNTNDTPSIVAGLGLADNPANAGRVVNSVPDQYVGQLGLAVPLPWKGLSANAAWRVEGLPRYDLIGRSDGFRRPGVEMFVQPGVTYSRGDSVWSFSVPIGVYRNRRPDPYSGRLGDATFPEYIFLASYSYRFAR